jgi:hypothetical protein
MIMRVLASCAALTVAGGAMGSAFDVFSGEAYYTYDDIAIGSMTFNVGVPAPAALALLGLAGLASRRRRR